MWVKYPFSFKCVNAGTGILLVIMGTIYSGWTETELDSFESSSGKNIPEDNLGILHLCWKFDDIMNESIDHLEVMESIHT